MFWQRQFSLRTLMFLIVGAAVLFAACARQRRNVEQYKAVDEIWALGGQTLESGETMFYRPTSNTSCTMAFPRSWVSRVFFSPKIEAVVFDSNSSIGDDDVLVLASYVKKLSTVRYIAISSDCISEDAANQLKQAIPECTVHLFNLLGN